MWISKFSPLETWRMGVPKIPPIPRGDTEYRETQVSALEQSPLLSPPSTKLAHDHLELWISELRNLCRSLSSEGTALFGLGNPG